MPSTGWESSDLLSQFNELAGRPSADAITDAQKYQRLARAQTTVVAKMMGVVPYSLYPKVAYGSLPTLTTTDNQVFTFGTDGDGYAVFPMGKGGIFTSLSDIPSNPWRPGIDYMIEGTQIRIPNNNTYSGTLYWYGVGQPTAISASTQPSLFPEGSRRLIVIEAVRAFSVEYLRNADLALAMEREWSGTPEMVGQWPTWCLAWRTAFRDGGALDWWSGLNLAIAGQGNWQGAI